MANLPVPNPRTFSAGEVEAGAYFNAMRDALNFLLNPPMAVLVQATLQTVANTAQPVITFDSTVADFYGGHSNSTNNSRYTAQVAGWYWVVGTLAFAANGVGNRGIQTSKNGTVQMRGQQVLPATGAANVATVECVSQVQLAAGDYVELVAFQSSGGNLNTVANSSSMEIWWAHA